MEEGAKLNTTGYFWGLFSLGIVIGAIGPSLPRLAANTGVSLGAAGILFSAYRGGYLAGSISGGAALDRFQGNRLVGVGILVVAAVMATVPTMSTLAALVGAFAAIGAAAGVVEVGGNTLLVWVYRERVGPWINGLHFALGVGAMLAPIVIGQSLKIADSLLPAYLVATIVMVPGAVILLFARSPLAPPADETERVTRDGVLILLFALFLLAYMGAETSFGGWIYAWSIKVHALSPTRAAALTSLFWGTLTAGRLLSVPLASRVAPRTMLVGTGIGVSLFLALIASPAGLTSEAVVWVAAAGTGLSMAAIIPTAISFAGAHMRVTGSVSRWFFAGAGLGGMTIPWALGRLMDQAGPGAVMPAIFAVSLVMAGVLAVLVVNVGRR